MQQRPMVMSKCGMVSATERAKQRIRSITVLAQEIAGDSRKRDRLVRHECRSCFYGSGIAGAAITHRPCMCCGKNVMYGSTATDVLCMACAVQHTLCRHCGGDLELRTRRKDWPSAPAPHTHCTQTESS